MLSFVALLFSIFSSPDGYRHSSRQILGSLRGFHSFRTASAIEGIFVFWLR